MTNHPPKINGLKQFFGIAIEAEFSSVCLLLVPPGITRGFRHLSAGVTGARWFRTASPTSDDGCQAVQLRAPWLST